MKSLKDDRSDPNEVTQVADLHERVFGDFCVDFESDYQQFAKSNRVNSANQEHIIKNSDKKDFDNVCHVFEYTSKRKIVGYILHWEETETQAYIKYIGVDPHYKGRGVARKLIEKICEIYADEKKLSTKNKRFKTIRLMAIDHPEFDLVKFYEKFGFKVTPHQNNTDTEGRKLTEMIKTFKKCAKQI